MVDDLRLALRRLWQAPGFTAMAVATLALAIGANAAVLSIADAVLFRPLPYRDPGSVYLLRTANPTTGRRTAAVPRAAVEKLNQHHTGLGDVADRGPEQIIAHTAGDETERVVTLGVSVNYFQVLGVQPARGRLFDSTDAADPSGRAVLSFNTWRSRFGGDETIVGRAVPLGSRSREVIGVLPDGFIFPAEFLFFPYGLSGAPEFVTLSAPLSPRARERPVLNPIVRLEPRVTREQAQAELDALLTGDPAAGGRVVLEDVRGVVFPVARSTMAFLVGAAVLVLLLGSANLANMFLARGRRREHDIGVCMALGATRARIVRPMVLEAVGIALAGSAVALTVTALAFDVLARQVPPIAYGTARVGLDSRVAIYAFALAVAGGLLFGVLPAWQLSKRDALGLLGRSRYRVSTRLHGRSLVAVQVALAVVLAFGAMIAARSFISVIRVPLGFEPENVLAIELRPNVRGNDKMLGFYVQAVEQLAVRGNVVSAGAGYPLPLSNTLPGAVATAAAGGPEAGVALVLPGYLETLRVPLIRGSFLIWDHFRSRSDVAVVSESAARILFPGAEAIGGTLTTHSGRKLTVVGIVSDIHSGFKFQPAAALVYAIDDGSSGRMALVARMRTRQQNAVVDIRRAIGSAAPGEPITVRWWDDAIGSLAEYRNPRFQTLVLGGFAALALLLTGLGTFAVVASLVAGLTREIGIRIAIGASPQSVVRLIVRHALSAVIGGSLAGVLAALWLARVAEAQLVAVEAQDATALALSTIAVIVTAVTASYLPARRAGRVDPIVVLRAE